MALGGAILADTLTGGGSFVVSVKDAPTVSFTIAKQYNSLYLRAFLLLPSLGKSLVIDHRTTIQDPETGEYLPNPNNPFTVGTDTPTTITLDLTKAIVYPDYVAPAGQSDISASGCYPNFTGYESTPLLDWLPDADTFTLVIYARSRSTPALGGFGYPFDDGGGQAGRLWDSGMLLTGLLTPEYAASRGYAGGSVTFTFFDPDSARGYFRFGDWLTLMDGVIVEKKKVYSLPERDITKIHVPGRNGDVLIDSGSYKNVTIAYDCAALSPEAVRACKRALSAPGGYALLTDKTGQQRLACCKDLIEFDELIPNRCFKFTVVFDCKPQIYADREGTIDATGGITYLTAPSGFFHCDPMVVIYGEGDIYVKCNGVMVHQFSSLVEFTDKPSAVIDCEAQICYKNNADGTRTVGAAAFPTDPTSYWQVYGDYLSKATIYPRWWRL